MTHFPEKTNTITSHALIFSYFVPTKLELFALRSRFLHERVYFFADVSFFRWTFKIWR
jgi:hypothetical protein